MALASGIRRVALCATLTMAAPVAANEPLEIWISSFQDDKYYKAMVERYQATVDSAFEANVTAYGFQEMPDKISVATRTGLGGPDIVQLDEIFFSMYRREGIPFVDLTDRFRATDLKDDLLAQRVELFQYDGRQYGVPQSVSALVMYYRADLLEEFELEPKDLDTWKKFEEVGSEILAKHGQCFLALDWSYFEILLRQRGYDLFGPNGEILFDSPEAIETLDFVARLQRMGIAQMPDRGHIFDPEFFGGDVLNREVMGMLGAGWYGLDMLHQYAPTMAGQWRAMPLPKWSDKKTKSRRRTSTFAGQGLMIFSASEQQERAWSFLRWIMEDREANVLRFTEGNSFTAHRPSWKDKRMRSSMEYFGGQSLGKLLESLAKDVPRVHSSPLRPLFLHLFREKYFAVVMRGDLGAGEALKALREEVEQAAAQY